MKQWKLSCTVDGGETYKFKMSFKNRVNIFNPILSNIAGNKDFQKSIPNHHSMNTRIYARVTFKYIKIKIPAGLLMKLERLDLNFIRTRIIL